MNRFVFVVCIHLFTYNFISCNNSKDIHGSAAIQDGSLSYANNPELLTELTLRDILAAYHNDTPCHEATFIRELEQQDGSIVLLVMLDGTPELLPQSYAESATNLLLEDGSCKVGIPWQDRPAEWYAYPQHRCQSRFVPVRSNGSGSKWTYADTCRDGTLLAPAIFEKVHPFKEGLGAVQYKGNWYFINEEGKIALTLEPNYLPTGAFYNGICIVRFPLGGTAHYGGIDRNGSLLFSFADRVFSKDGVYSVGNFYEENIAKVNKDNREFLAIARDGTILIRNLTSGDIETRYSPIEYFDFRYRDGTVCLTGYFDEATYAQTKSERKSTFYGAFDKRGAWVIEPVYKNYKDVEELLKRPAAMAKKDADSGLYGIASKEETWLIAPRFTAVETWGSKSRPYFEVSEPTGKHGIVDSEGKVAVAAEYDSILFLHTVQPFFCVASRGGKYGVIDGHGNELLPFTYNEWDAEIKEYTDSYLPPLKDEIVFAPLPTESPDDIVHETSLGLAFSFHPLAAEEREPKDPRATCYRVRIFAKDGTELFADRAFYEEYFEDGV